MHDSPPANGRWIVDVSRDEFAWDVAIRTIRRRVQTVEHYLPLAATEAEKDVEHVHQLRVATRRAVAAVQLYRRFLPKKSRKLLCRQLKQIRRAAGSARDCDVMLERHLGQAGKNPSEHLLEDLRTKRAEAQRPLYEVYQAATEQQTLAHLCDDALARAKQQGLTRRSLRFGRWARRELRESIRAFFAAEPYDLEDLAAIHQFRLRGKDLRYGVELLAGVFPKRLRTRLYPLIEELQERLGTVNDHAVAIERFRDWRKAAQDSQARKRYRKLIKSEKRRLEKAIWEFARWWTPQRSKQTQRRFRKLLHS